MFEDEFAIVRATALEYVIYLLSSLEDNFVLSPTDFQVSISFYYSF
jgi:hypothetical protein